MPTYPEDNEPCVREGDQCVTHGQAIEVCEGTAACDLCGRKDEHTHTDEEYGGQYSPCPVCGDPYDYCQGHGEIGDPYGYSVLLAHEDDDHSQCHPNAECREE